MKINRELSKTDKLIIVARTFPKIVRGLLKLPFFQSISGLLFIGKKVQLSHLNHISVGKYVKFEDFSEIHGLSKNGLVFSNNVTIGRGAMIRPSSYYGVGEIGSGLFIGENSSIGPHAYIGCAGQITIGKNVMFGPKCSLFAENHVFNSSDISIKSQGVVQKGITIEDDCWIGSNVIILDGVTIGQGSVIGAGSLVNKDIPSDSIFVNKRERHFSSRS